MQQSHVIKYKECPSCKELKMHPNIYLNALSRKDNETYICSDCGTSEAFLEWSLDGFGHRN